jgi:hypothetical protein
MIHLITSHQGIADALPWIASEDLIVLAGNALDGLHTIHTPPCEIALLSDDALLYSNDGVSTLTMDDWIELLEKNSCRTWS